jgi:hypothetical protein
VVAVEVGVVLAQRLPLTVVNEVVALMVVVAVVILAADVELAIPLHSLIHYLSHYLALPLALPRKHLVGIATAKVLLLAAVATPVVVIITMSVLDQIIIKITDTR